MFPAPQASRVTVWVPRALPFVDVEIGAGQAPTAPGQTLDPAGAALGQPTIRPLINSSESAEEAVDEDATTAPSVCRPTCCSRMTRRI